MKEKINRFFADLSEKITYRHWVLLAGIASLVLGLLVFAGLNGMGANEEAKPVNTIHVVVAKQDIAPKTIIKESMVEVREVPALWYLTMLYGKCQILLTSLPRWRY